MLATELSQQPLGPRDVSAEPRPLSAELHFYQAYSWCLNPYPTVREAVDRLRGEIGRLESVPEGWQTAEVATNIFLLSCALLNAVEEYLRGPALRLPDPAAALRLGRGARWAMEIVTGIPRQRRLARAGCWQERWKASLGTFLSILVASEIPHPAAVAKSAHGLTMLLQKPLPRELAAEHVGAPSPFRRLDLTHFDVLALGQRYATRFPDRSQPILLLGLRTSGSYFAPLLAASLQAAGYQTVFWLTIHAKKGPSRRERRTLGRCARRGCTALIVDDPPNTAETIQLALDIAHWAGFAQDRLRVLAPTHPARRDWAKSLSTYPVVTLEPERWHIHESLDPGMVEQRLSEYFPSASLRLVGSQCADQINATLQGFAHGERGSRLKRVYEVRLETASGQMETRYVLAKSVGWGWLGYHAFLAGSRLTGFVPPILGLRSGILYSEWTPSRSLVPCSHEDREERIATSASYVAARVRGLGLTTTPTSGNGLRREDIAGLRLLAKVLSKAYGRCVSDTLVRPWLERRLNQQLCPNPTLIDGRMEPAEWIAGSRGWLKTDYEHHGLGKTELNVVDPAYDLAETILTLALTPAEECGLIRRYVAESGDAGITQRLFMNKLLAGLWAMDSAQQHLFSKSHTSDLQQQCHERYMNAWNFLTVHTARFCGSRWRLSAAPEWCAPLVALDIDGVLDRRLFGFPCTTAAGMQALSLLHGSHFSVALNTARSVSEVKDYCQAYSLAGGVAEHGSYLWDAIAQRGQVLISAEAMRQLQELREALHLLPGVFLDDRHQYSIRAFTYQEKAGGLLPSLLNSLRPLTVGVGSPAPLPTLVVRRLISVLRLDRLSFHHTRNDTTIVAKDGDKGTGLSALRDWVGVPIDTTVAVGDSEHDLPMFRVATRSFAPAHIDCARRARLLGCQIVGHPYQRGLLDVARLLVREIGGECSHRADVPGGQCGKQDLFLNLLQAADRPWATSSLRALSGAAGLRILFA